MKNIDEEIKNRPESFDDYDNRDLSEEKQAAIKADLARMLELGNQNKGQDDSSADNKGGK